MRIYSTPQSAEAGEISLLAIIETVASVSISIWIAVHYETVNHIVFGACLAPLFLLRTPKSTDFALGYGLVFTYRQWTFLKPALAFVSLVGNRVVTFVVQRRQPTKAILAILSIFALFVAVLIILLVVCFATILGPLAIRFVAMVYGLIGQSPIDNIRAIPANWKRLTWATDFLHPPEVIPGIETLPTPDSSDPSFPAYSFLLEWKFWDLMRNSFLLQNPHRSVRIFFRLMGLVFLLIYVPIVLFRLSVKSTSIVYIPFLYVAKQPLSDLSAKEMIADIVHGKGEFLKRWYAALNIFVLLCSILHFLRFPESIPRASSDG